MRAGVIEIFHTVKRAQHRPHRHPKGLQPRRRRVLFPLTTLACVVSFTQERDNPFNVDASKYFNTFKCRPLFFARSFCALIFGLSLSLFSQRLTHSSKNYTHFFVALSLSQRYILRKKLHALRVKSAIKFLKKKKKHHEVYEDKPQVRIPTRVAGCEAHLAFDKRLFIMQNTRKTCN